MNPRSALLLALFAYIPSSASLIGAVYYSLTNLHTDTIVYEFQAILVPTVVLPVLILLLGERGNPSSTWSGGLVTAGIWIWFTGGLLSALSHPSTDGVWLTFITGIGSALLVYCASLAMDQDAGFTEKIMCCVIASGLIPGVLGIIAYYQNWGIPSALTLLYSRYDLPRMQPYLDAAFGNTGAAACFFSMLAAPCLVILTFKLFRWPVRALAVSGFCVSILNLIIDQARTSYFAFGLTVLLVLIFKRSGRLVAVTAAACVAIGVLTPSDVASQVWDSLQNAASYSVEDNSAIERVESIKIGWEQFADNPVAGIGPGQSNRYNRYYTAHDLAVSQAAEIGVLGLIGVLSLTAGVLIRIVELLLSGPGTPRATMSFLFTLAPCVYFSSGAVSTVFVNNAFHNTWICLVMGLMAGSEVWFRSDAVSPDGSGVAALEVAA